MAVVVADIVVLLQGEANDAANGYIVWKKYDVKTTRIQATIDMVTRYATIQISEAMRVTEHPNEFDDLIKNETCARIIMEQIMGLLMATGFSFTTLELTVNANVFPEIVTASYNNFMVAARNLYDVLKERVKIIHANNYGMDPYGIFTGNNPYFKQTSPWR